jgi:hypothetical protein
MKRTILIPRIPPNGGIRVHSGQFVVQKLDTGIRLVSTTRLSSRPSDYTVGSVRFKDLSL